MEGFGNGDLLEIGYSHTSVVRLNKQVNLRLAKADLESGKADAQSPRTVWPTKHLCSDCFSGTNPQEPVWNHDAVYKFLTNWYGPSLQRPAKLGRDAEAEIRSGGDSLVKGAFLGILLAGAGFGIFSWWLRTQQKKRKY